MPHCSTGPCPLLSMNMGHLLFRERLSGLLALLFIAGIPWEARSPATYEKGGELLLVSPLGMLRCHFAAETMMCPGSPSLTHWVTSEVLSILADLYTRVIPAPGT